MSTTSGSSTTPRASATTRFVPGLKLPDHEESRQEVQVAPGCGLGHAERACGLGGVPDPAVVVSEHRPEAQQGGSRNRDAELGKVTLEVRVDELLAPDVARLLRPGEIGGRLSALAPNSSRPNPCSVTISNLPASVSEDCLRRSGVALPRIRKRARGGRRSARTRKTGKRSGRRWISSMTTTPRSGARAVIGSARRARLRRLRRHDLSGQRGLAGLARAHQGGDPATPQRRADLREPSSPRDHASTLP